ncbi:hypothetical protein [Rubritalea halochordaticola]|uniref:hypothetical protein n=1 Tax=Rubritalea halochordaticola TaxID=714537 RepID=UPI0031FD98F7
MTRPSRRQSSSRKSPSSSSSRSRSLVTSRGLRSTAGKIVCKCPPGIHQGE